MTGGGELRRGRVALAVAICAALVLLCCGGGGLAAFLLGGDIDDNADVYGFGCGDAAMINVNGEIPRVGRLGDEQMQNAARVISVGQEMRVPPRGWVIATATALKEFQLINLGHLGARNDHDSLGLF